MARIPESEVERLKKDVSVERLASAAGVELKRHGADLLGRCPFHDDRTPSLVISPEKNLWHCLGVCQAGGSVIDWVMRAQGVSFRHAVELLREEHPSLAAPLLGSVKHSTVRKLAAPIEHDADDRALLLQVIDFYHATLKQSPEALQYLKKRGLDSAEMIDRFKLGFANRTLGLRLPARNRDAGAEIRGRLIKLGLYRDSGHEHFNGSIVIPVLDDSGAVTEVYGRKITDGLRPGTPLHLYLPGPHRGVWNIAALQCSKEIILCEALIDALTFWCAGFRNVTASYGVEGFTADHLAAFTQHGTKRVLIAYDRDDAGDGAAEKLAERLMGEGIECFRVQFPKGMDANAYALNVTPATKSLGLALRHAVWMGTGAAPKVPHEPVEIVHKLAAESAPEPAADEAPTIDEAPAPPAAIPSLAAKDNPAAILVPEAAQHSASPLPEPQQAPDVAVEIKPEEILITIGERRYRIRGLGKNTSFDALKVNVLVSRGEHFYVDTLDIYQARQRTAFIKQAALDIGAEEETIKKDLGKVLLKLEALQESEIKKALEPKDKGVKLSDPERDAALELLSDPKLLDRILADFRRCGVVGEETNKLVGYIASVSRKLEQPLAVIIQSTSAAGKSSLMEAVLAFMPEEDKVKYSAMTGQSLFYMGENDLKHKILAIAEEEGAERASYALKLLQSEGELAIASTGKDPETGRHVTHEYRVEGPVMIFLTTTAVEIDEELLNRCVVLSVDEDREQTRAIHGAQREAQTIEGLLARKDRERIIKLHRDAQRLLRPLLVANPYARRLTFLDHRTRTRRDHGKYLTLIRSIALLHQYQRPVKSTIHRGQSVPFIEVAISDIAIANKLAHQVLGHSLDELPPQTRRFLLLLDKMVSDACVTKKIDRSDYRFSRREAREHTGGGYSQSKIHLDRLLELEYVACHRGKNGQSYVYELCYDGRGQDGAAFLMGLIDVGALGLGGDVPALGNDATTETFRGGTTDLSAGFRGAFGPVSATSRGAEMASEPSNNSHRGVERPGAEKNADQAALLDATSCNRTRAVAGAR